MATLGLALIVGIRARCFVAVNQMLPFRQTKFMMTPIGSP
jgi:hypothetical protein